MVIVAGVPFSRGRCRIISLEAAAETPSWLLEIVDRVSSLMVSSLANPELLLSEEADDPDERAKLSIDGL